MKTTRCYWLAVPLLLFALGGGVAGAERQVLHGQVPAAAAKLRPIERLAPGKSLDLVLALPLRNRAELTNLLQQLYDPSSPSYHRYLTPQEFAERFGPSQEDYDRVIAFAKAQGLTVTSTHPNRTLLDVTGTVGKVEKVFHVNLRSYRHPKENRTFYAPDTEPSLDLATPMLAIGGLDDFSLPKPMSLRASPLEATPLTTLAATGSGPNGTFLGRDFRAAYALGVSLDGSGQSVGLLEFDGYFPSDISAYLSLAGLPNVPLTNVLLNNVKGGAGSANVEVALDIDMAIAMAPGLSRVMVYEGRVANDILNRMATDNLAKQLSSSWSYGLPVDPAREQIFMQFAAQGQSMFQASGDLGAWSGAVASPSDDTYLTIVGGTSLTTSGPGGTWVSETVWPGSGGGVSTSYAIPSWQRGVANSNNQGSATMRNIPDVACLADVTIWLVANNGLHSRIGGTSAATPLWAGFAALANQQAASTGQPSVGFLNPALYAIGEGGRYPSLLHDITLGNNENTDSPTNFSAVPGYDLCTGWGTPTGSSLIDALLAPPDALQIFPGDGTIFSGPTNGPFYPATASYILANFGAAPLNWTLVNTSAWLKVSSTNGTLNPSGPATTTVKLSVNPSATNLAPGNYAGTLWFTNQNNGFGQGRAVTLAVVTPPVIVSQPSSQAVMEGSTVNLSVGTTSNALLFYQWRQDNGMYLTNLSDGPNVSGSKTATLTIGEMAGTNVGIYSVVVSNAAGVTTSSNASLTILPWRPVITSQPVSRTALPGETVRFDVSVIGSEPFIFRWQENGTNLTDSGNVSGSGTSELAIANVTALNAGTYSVLVSNAYGWASSSGAMLTVLPVTATNVSFATVYSFTGGSDGAQPNGLARGTNGSFYGTTQTGGANSYGTVFQLSPGGAVSPLYSFTGGGDGGNPQAPLALATDGSLYGTAFDGGTSGYGTVFRAGPNGQPVAMASLDKPGAILLYAGVIQGRDGNFYGTGYEGGTGLFYGGIFKMAPDGTLTTFYSFTGGNDGGFPYAGLVQGTDGAFYGTTFKGGPSGYGTVFRIATNGALTPLASFTGTNGAYPYAGLTLGDDGSFYGVASSGGAYTNGSVFRVTSTGLTNLYSFTGGTDGATPVGTLLLGSDGNFYGTTAYGGSFSLGTLFMISPAGVLTTLAQFGGAGGANPMEPLAQDIDGTFYGTTQNGGANGRGAIYRFSISGAPQITSQPANQAVYAGATVVMSVAVSGSQPMFYQWRRSGTNITDGGNISGTTSRTLIFSNAIPANSGSYSVAIGNGLGLATSASGTLTVMSSAPFFTVQPTNQTVLPGANATFGALALGNLPLTYQWQRNGTNMIDGGGFSGTTTPLLSLTNATEANKGTYSVVASNALGTLSSAGAVLTVVPPSAPGTVMTTLYGFTGGDDGRAPNGIAMGTNGVLYGTTEFGGAHRLGTTFSLTTNGALTTLTPFAGIIGVLPLAGLVQGSDGNFYGTTRFGGTNSFGNIFRMTADGTVSNLYSFSGNEDGSQPDTELVEGSPGTFYGTTVDAGSNAQGSIFSLTTNGVFTNVYSFSGGADGGAPTVKLTRGNDGALYGMTASGGAKGFGTIFRMTPDGSLKTFYSFTGGTDGYSPAGGLVQSEDGNFYGVTTFNKIQTITLYGTIFKVSTNGTLTTLYSLNYGDGTYPQAGLVEGLDGNFYGTTYSGAANGNGAVYRISPTGAYTTLVSFDGFNDGMHPQSALVQGADGSIYGTTPSGGYGAQGTAFRLRLSGAPQITGQPINQSALAGTSANFSVAVFGSAPFSYQWQFNGTNLADGVNVSGSTNRFLTLNHITATNGGNYSVMVSNPLGLTNSATALLTVLFQPAFQNVTQTNGTVYLTWSAIVGQRYRVQWKASLSSSTWLNLGPLVTASSSTMVTTDVIGTNAQRFYRVLLMP